MKKCTHCYKVKSLKQFEAGKNQCRPCRYQIQKERARNQERDNFRRLVSWPAPDWEAIK